MALCARLAAAARVAPCEAACASCSSRFWPSRCRWPRPHPVVTEAYRFLPDGRVLLYTTDAKGAEGMRIMDARSRESWPLCPGPGDAEFCKRLDARASWAPNGTFIVVGHREPARVERLAWEGVTAEAVAKLMRRR